ncbi:14970_t:CDS:2, partial [Funneliformis geosporum]
MSQPQIVIDSNEEFRIVCRLLFYNIPSFHPNAKKLHKACQEKGYSFRLQDIAKWVHQYDILLHTHDDQDGRRQNPKQPFKYEELQVIEEPDKVEYPPDEFMRKYHPTGFIYYVNASSN